MAIMVGTGRGATAGVLIKNAEALERLEEVDTLVVDKTGTLTEGKPTLVGDRRRRPASARTRCCGWPPALEQASEHPLAAAIVAARASAGVTLAGGRRTSSRSPGKGVAGRVDGRRVVARQRRR